MSRTFLHVTGWGWFWLAWALSASAVELYWVAVNAANTLSRQLWALEGVDPMHPLELSDWTPAHWIIAIILWLFFLWMSIHIPFYYFR